MFVLLFLDSGDPFCELFLGFDVHHSVALKMGDLPFKEPDHAKYPSMQVAYGAGRAGGTMTGALAPALASAVYVAARRGPAAVHIAVTRCRQGCLPVWGHARSAT